MSLGYFVIILSATSPGTVRYLTTFSLAFALETPVATNSLSQGM